MGKIARITLLFIAIILIILPNLSRANISNAPSQPVNISSCALINQSGYYILTRDINASESMMCIMITVSNVVLDGAGHTIEGLGNYHTIGIYVKGSTTLTNVTVRNLTVKEWFHGIRYENVIGGLIEDSMITKNFGFGIFLSQSRNITITGNAVDSNYCPGIFLHNSSDNTISDNSVSFNTEGISLSASSNSNLVLDNNASSNTNRGITVTYSNNNTVSMNYIGRNIHEGIFLQEAGGNTITKNNVISNGYHGINLYSSRQNIVTDNYVALNRQDGIVLHSASQNVISGNTILENRFRGVSLWKSSGSNTVASNTIRANKDAGISIDSSNRNIIAHNNVGSNRYGVFLFNSNDNLIYDNYLNNTKNAQDNGENRWNIEKTAGTNIVGGPCLGGNYWSDYSGRDTDGDGFGNTMLPYTAGGNILHGGDYLPLVPVSENASCTPVTTTSTTSTVSPSSTASSIATSSTSTVSSSTTTPSKPTSSTTTPTTTSEGREGTASGTGGEKATICGPALLLGLALIPFILRKLKGKR
ncbi:nitrous oxide reductase family maturation protein NosD [Thermococcus sp. MAR1]|uniref:right-handed parallel beta-helix repeat-containing protein n=1 Tax=Thermococcus sp. MAR1 TaxID=1638263 RepID=UPI00143B0631|nr:NosD domain-containing protein [Thermococcus sp. MAR1]NJE09990.1 CGP-CTERM sorting domain-containing protein [Thermococcus sp. MAR1]